MQTHLLQQVTQVIRPYLDHLLQLRPGVPARAHKEDVRVVRHAGKPLRNLQAVDDAHDAAAGRRILAIGEQSENAHGGDDGQDESQLHLAELHQAWVGRVEVERVLGHLRRLVGEGLEAVEAEAQRLPWR